MHQLDQLLVNMRCEFVFYLFGPLQQQKWHLLLQFLAHGLVYQDLHLALPVSWQHGLRRWRRFGLGHSRGC